MRPTALLSDFQPAEGFLARQGASQLKKFLGVHAQIRTLLGAAMVWIDQNLFAGRLPFTLHDSKPDHACLDEAAVAKPIIYPKPDNQITFDRLSSVFLSNTNHEEDQPCHLTLRDQSIPIESICPSMPNLPSVIARRGYTKSWTNQTAHASKSTPRTVYIAKPAISRIHRRTSHGLRRKALGGPTTPTCDGARYPRKNRAP
ncbi:MAG: hypothetical protein CM15mP84_07480 [Cellvibrionales bacterium]|nr:MAG: hypothetical protein CM15mP84_07480 [Cellvibrionales bacterium]